MDSTSEKTLCLSRITVTCVYTKKSTQHKKHTYKKNTILTGSENNIGSKKYRKNQLLGV